MIKLNEEHYALDFENCPNDFGYIKIEDVNDDNLNDLRFAIKVEFKNDLESNVKIIKNLIYIINNEKTNDFYTLYDNKKVKFLIKNYTNSLLVALKASLIKEEKTRVEYLYDYLCDYIDNLWNEKNPCQFDEHSSCIAQRMKVAPYDIHGCCYSFNYTKNPLTFTTKSEVCKYLEKGKGCTQKNLSCKIFVCKYLRENRIFNIDFDKYVIPKAFFSENQILIMKYNHFHTRDELIDKILKNEKTPNILYDLHGDYRISKPV